MTSRDSDAAIARVIHLGARRHRDSGLWAALASSVDPSAAGSGLAGPFRPGLPISVEALDHGPMFDPVPAA